MPLKQSVKSKQAEIEKIIEGQIYKRVLQAQDIDEHVEFEWGQPSDAEKMQRITKLTELLNNPLLSSPMRKDARGRIGITYEL